jgi:UDPglucose 6-dehydrogenase
VKALIKTSDENGYEMRILKAVDCVNEQQRMILVDKLKTHFKGKIKNLRVAIWGLAFKPRTDDLREAPSLLIISRLLEAGVKVFAHDPVANRRAKGILGNKVELFENNYEALKGADALFVVTEWNEFRQPNLDRMKRLMKHPVVFDGRNIFDAKEMRARGFTYYGIGK